MKKSTPFIIQIAIWLGIYSIFAFTGNAETRLPMYYHVITIRVLGFALFFNLAYFALLPLYFSGRKRAFFLLAPVLFAGYIGFSVLVDLTLAKPDKMYVLKEGQAKNYSKKRPLSWLLIPPVFIGFALFGTAATIRGFSAFENKKKEEEEANRRRLEAEIALLKSQINPHFLLNTLNNLYTLALVEPEKTPDALLKLSEMVGYILHECAKPKVSLSSDIDFIENYIALQRLRLPPNIHLHTELPANLPPALQIEPMILIPFIENAFKHGLTTRQASEIFISINIQGDHLFLLVKNPLLPGKQLHNGNSSGIGLANTRQRLQHSYNGTHSLRMKDDGNEHRVELELKLGL